MGTPFPLVSSKSHIGFILTCGFVSHVEFNLHVRMETYSIMTNVIMGFRVVMTTLYRFLSFRHEPICTCNNVLVFHVPADTCHCVTQMTRFSYHHMTQTQFLSLFFPFNINIKLSLWLNTIPRRLVRGLEVMYHAFLTLTSALDNNWSALPFSHFTAWVYCIRGLVVFGIGLNLMEKENNSSTRLKP
jgi:hypothetical protein